jgi:hypothetical protein
LLTCIAALEGGSRPTNGGPTFRLADPIGVTAVVGPQQEGSVPTLSTPKWAVFLVIACLFAASAGSVADSSETAKLILT